GHEADVARGERPEVRRIEDPEQPADQREQQRGAGQRERDRKTDEERRDDAEEHEDGENLAKQNGIHLGLPLAVAELRGQQVFPPGEYEDAAREHRDSLQSDQDDERQDEGLEDEQAGHPARV